MIRTGGILIVVSFLHALSLHGETKGDNGRKIGDPCINFKCGGMNLICNNRSRKCECLRDFPIVVTTDRNETLCLKEAKLEEECWDDKSCLARDENSRCQQINNRAQCGCTPDYHQILDKSSGQFKCVEIRQHSNSDLTTFVGVGVGMTLFCGIMCLVLRIFARARFGPRRSHYANAHLAPPTVVTEHADGQEGLNSRHSSQRSSFGGGGVGGGGGSRRPSMLAPPGPRPGDSRRASNSSIRSSSSARSYSLKYQSQHRPSEPEMLLAPQLPTNISPSNKGQRSPQKDSRSSSTGTIGLN